MTIQIKKYQSFNPELTDLWRTFERQAVFHGFQNMHWLNRWQSMVGQSLNGARLNICVVRDAGQVIAILPLYIRRSFGIAVLEWMGGTQCDFHGPLLLPGSVMFDADRFAEIWATIQKTVNPFDVINLQRQTQLVGEQPNPFVAFLDNRRHDDNYLVDLHTDWETYYSGQFGKKTRRTFKRKHKKLSAIGELKFQVVANQQDHDDLLSKLYAMKRERFHNTGLFDLFSRQEIRDFYRIEGKLGATTSTHLSVVTVDDDIVAIHWGMIHKDTFYFILPAFNDAYARCSPGHVLISHLIQWAMENDMATFDFTIGPETYKSDWCNFRYDLCEHIRPVTLRGYGFIGLNLPRRKLQNIQWLKNLVRAWRRKRSSLSSPGPEHKAPQFTHSPDQMLGSAE